MKEFVCKNENLAVFEYLLLCSSLFNGGHQLPVVIQICHKYLLTAKDNSVALPQNMGQYNVE